MVTLLQVGKLVKLVRITLCLAAKGSNKLVGGLKRK